MEDAEGSLMRVCRIKRPRDIDIDSLFKDSNGAGDLPERSHMAATTTMEGGLERISDKDLKEKIRRLAADVARLSSRMPDRGEKLKSLLRAHEEERERRKHPIAPKTSHFCTEEQIAMDSVKLGPFGYGSEHKWDHKGLTQIVQIIVAYGPEFIHSLQFQYLKNGRLHTSEVLGCQDFSRSPMFNTITFQSSNERITEVKGVCNDERRFIEKLSIHTNLKTYEIFEAEETLPLYSSRRSFSSFNFGGLNQFGGFFGTHNGDAVTSIGVYFNRLLAPPAGYLQDEPRPSQDHQHDEDHVDVDVH